MASLTQPGLSRGQKTERPHLNIQITLFMKSMETDNEKKPGTRWDEFSPFAEAAGRMEGGPHSLNPGIQDVCGSGLPPCFSPLLLCC